MGRGIRDDLSRRLPHYLADYKDGIIGKLKVTPKLLLCKVIYQKENWGLRPDHNFRPKKYHFLFLLPFDSEALKTCKNTIKFVCSTLSLVGSG